METGNVFDPNEWAKDEFAPKKSAVNNQQSAGAYPMTSPTELYQQVESVVNEVVSWGVCLTDDYQDWVNVGFALAEGLGESGRNFFHTLSSMSSKYEWSENDKKYTNLLNSHRSGITVSTFFHQAKQAGIDIRPVHMENDFCAVCADAHESLGNEIVYNPLTINDENSVDVSCAPAHCAHFEGEEMELNIQFVSTFSDKIPMEDWSEFLRPIATCRDTAAKNDSMILASMTNMSAFLPNFHCMYGDKVAYANLNCIIDGPAASSKGDTTHTLNLVKPIKKEILSTYFQEQEAFELAHAEWESKSSKSEKATRGPEPQAPQYRTPILAADSSATAFTEALNANGGSGLMFETEADVLTETLSKDYGNYSTLIRRTTHHETISINRVRDNTHIEIETPRLSVFLTCTPGQLAKLFPNFEDGFGSRFLFYGLEQRLEWKDPFANTGQPLGEVFDELGQQFHELYHLMEGLDRSIQFIVTEEQQKRFNDYFSALLNEQFYMLGEGISAFIFRMGLYTIRIAMILAILRKYSDRDSSEPLFKEGEKALVCSDKDFHIAMTMMDTLVNHTATIYSYLAKDSERYMFTHEVKLNEAERNLYMALPDEYTTEGAKTIAAGLGMNPNSVRRYLGDYVNKHRIAKRITNGHFQKINIKSKDA